MKLAAQADFYIEKFGPKEGTKKLKEIGYQNIVYTITPQTFAKFSDDDFCLNRSEIEKAGMQMTFAICGKELYLDHAPHEFEGRKQMCIKALKAAALMGCSVLGVRPLAFRNSTPNAWEESKRLTYELYSEVREEADKLGVKLAFFNNTKQPCFSSGTYSYGCRASELLELAKNFDSGIIIDPAYALKAGERVEELLTETKDKLLGFCISDMAQREMTQALPMFGSVDYQGLIHFFQDYESDAAVVMMYTPIMNRYSDFVSNQELISSITRTYLKVARLIEGKE